MKLHRKIKHEKVCYTQDLGFLQGQDHIRVGGWGGHYVPRVPGHLKNRMMMEGQRSNLCFSHNSETAETNLMKLHRKVKHNEKECRRHDLTSDPIMALTLGIVT